MSKREYVGIRTTKRGIAAGTVAGRLPNSGSGGLKQIPIAQFAQQLTATGAVAAPGSGAPANIADSRIMANISGSSAPPAPDALSAILDHILGSTEGQIIQRGASAWQVLAPGSANQPLVSGGAAALNAWMGLSALIDAAIGGVQGDILYRDSALWMVLPPGTNGQVLTTQGASANPKWATSSAASFNNRGAWSGSSAYNPFDVVTYEGSAYLDYIGITAPAAPAQQWDTADHTGMTLSTTNTTNDTAVSTSTANANTQGNVPETAGKWYFEFVCSNLLDNGTTVGIAQTALAANFGGNALGVVSGGMTGHGTGSFAGLTNGKRGGVAVDLTNKLFWITADVTAASINWNGSTSNSPGAGTGGLTITTGAIGTMHPSFYSPTSANQKCILHSQSTDFLIPSIPAGFSAWVGASTPNNPPDEDSAHWIAQGNTYAPGGRLSLTSGVAVQTADAVGVSNIYYVPYIHRGLGHLGLDLTAQLTLALDSNSGHTGYHQSGKNFDIFVDGSTGTPRLVTGPAWTSDTARSAAIDQTTVPGLWTNTATMTTKFDTTASTYSAPAGTLLYVGSFRATANGQCTCQFNPPQAVGGSNTIIGLFNAYNRVPCYSTSRDSTANWSYTGVFRNANASTSNRISFIDGLGVIPTKAQYICNVDATQALRYGITFNTTGTPDVIGDIQTLSAGSFISTTPFAVALPVLGFNYWQAVEANPLSTANFFGNGFQMLNVSGEY